VKLLKSLESEIESMLDGTNIILNMDKMGILQQEPTSEQHAHVLLVGSSDDSLLKGVTGVLVAALSFPNNTDGWLEW
jgi:hypothetical protein